MTNTLVESYLNAKQKSVGIILSEINLICEEKGISPPCRRTVQRAINKIDSKDVINKRQGKRAAYQRQEWYWELTQTTPRHGERPFHIAHLDHTELDIELLDSKSSKKLGRIHLTLLVDAFSRRVLAFYISFNRPSKATNMMVMRECVKRHGRLPQILVVDNGKDFGSEYFETLLAYYGCIKKVRPPAEPRNGSLLERLFGTTNTQFIHNLAGNTKIMKEVRLVTKAFNPKELALWTFPSLYFFMRCYFYDVYDKIEHPALLETPRKSFQEGIEKFGERKVRYIPYDQIFMIITLPPAERNKYTVSSQSGIRFQYINYFCTEFENPLLDKAMVQVRYDPDDASICYAYVNKKWIKCFSDHYKDFRDKSWAEIKIATEEIKEKRKLHEKNKKFSSVQIAKFLRSTEGQEKLLLQRIKDREMRYVNGFINSDSTDYLLINDQAEFYNHEDQLTSLEFEEVELEFEDEQYNSDADNEELNIYQRLEL